MDSFSVERRRQVGFPIAQHTLPVVIVGHRISAALGAAYEPSENFKMVGTSLKQRIVAAWGYLRKGASTERYKLPDRRAGESIDFEHMGFCYTGTVGRFPDGRVGEVFLNAIKTGTMLEAVARDSCVAASHALQRGCELEDLRRGMTRNGNGEASGPLGAFLDIIDSDSATEERVHERA